MRCKVASTSVSEAYRAGLEIGNPLKEISPEIILLFTSISFEGNFGDFFEGLYDALQTRKVVVFGGTGDGIYETGRVAHYGVCALGISSNGAINWSVAVRRGVGRDSHAASLECCREALDGLPGDVSWAFVLADGARADGTLIVEGARDVLPIPFVGGLTGDDRKFTRSLVFVNGAEIEDAVAVLLASGPISFVANAASGWNPLGEIGVVEDCRGNVIRRISSVSAQTFMMEQLGKPLAEADLGVVPLATYCAPCEEGFFLRTPSSFNDDGSVTVFGSIPRDSSVRVCNASRDEVLKGVREALGGMPLQRFKPCAAIIISCAGRKWLLDDCGDEEVGIVKEILGEDVPFIGFPSFGEISPLIKPDGSYTSTFFHNVTFVVCVLGE